MSSELIEELSALYVWPQSIADHHADILTPRQIKKLYEVGAVAERAAATIAALQAELAEARNECLEQARLLGMSAERELALQARLTEAREVPGKIVDWLSEWHPAQAVFPENIATAIEARDWSK